MSDKPTYEELEKRVQALEQTCLDYREAGKNCAVTLEKLKASDEFHKAVIESISDVIFITDDVGNFTYICPNSHIIFGMTPEKIATFGNISILFGTTLFNLDELLLKNEIQNIKCNIMDSQGKIHFLLVTVKRVSIKTGTILYTCRDISERKQDDEAIRLRDEQLNLILDSVRYAIWGWRLDTGDVFFNAHWYTILGYTPYELPQAYDTWRNLLHPDDVYRAERKVHLHRQSGEPFTMEFRMRAKNGQWKWVLSQGKAVERDAYGNVLRLIGTHMDITEKKRIEEALRQNEAIFYSSFDNENIGMAVADPHGKFISVAPAMCRMLGFSENEMLKLTFMDITHVEDIKRSRHQYEKYLDDHNPFSMEKRYYTRKKKTTWGLTTVSPLFDSNGEFIHSIIHLLDITKRKEAEKVLQESAFQLEKMVNSRIRRLLETTVTLHNEIHERKKIEKKLRETQFRYRTVADAAFNLEWWQNPDGTFNYISPSCKRITGYEPDDFLTTPELMARIVLPEDRAIWSHHQNELFKKGALQEIEFRIRRKDGTICWLEHVCHRVNDEKGNVMGHRASSRDITRRKKAESESQRHREQLTHVARVATLGELAASIAHEINQPLTAILTNAQVGLRFLNRDNPDLGQVREILEDIVSDDKRARDVIRRLHPLFRKEKMSGSKININSIVMEVIAIMEIEVAKRKITMEPQLDDSIPPIQGDRIYLQQVIINAILNASDTMKESTSDCRKMILSTAWAGTTHVKVSVRDFGHGIDEENPDQLLEPFYTTKPEGMGMGLSINRSIIEAHEGKVWITNNVDGGATFLFTLPLSVS